MEQVRTSVEYTSIDKNYTNYASGNYFARTDTSRITFCGSWSRDDEICSRLSQRTLLPIWIGSQAVLRHTVVPSSRSALGRSNSSRLRPFISNGRLEDVVCYARFSISSRFHPWTRGQAAFHLPSLLWFSRSYGCSRPDSFPYFPF
jgi:hypothetical protein